MSVSIRNRFTSRTYAVITLVTLLSACFSLAALAQKNTPPVIPFSQITGAPLPHKRNLPAGFYIRRGLEKDTDEIVLTTHGLNGDTTQGMIFTGRITVDNGAPMVNAQSIFLEKEHKEGIVVKGNTMEFRFLTYGEIDMLSFRAPAGQRVTFTLFANGRPVQAVALGGKPEWVNVNGVVTLDLKQ